VQNVDASPEKKSIMPMYFRFLFLSDACLFHGECGRVAQLLFRDTSAGTAYLLATFFDCFEAHTPSRLWAGRLIE
jgi:hypothetical protein